MTIFFNSACFVKRDIGQGLEVIKPVQRWEMILDASGKMQLIDKHANALDSKGPNFSGAISGIQ